MIKAFLIKELMFIKRNINNFSTALLGFVIIASVFIPVLNSTIESTSEADWEKLLSASINISPFAPILFAATFVISFTNDFLFRDRLLKSYESVLAGPITPWQLWLCQTITFSVIIGGTSLLSLGIMFILITFFAHTMVEYLSSIHYIYYVMLIIEYIIICTCLISIMVFVYMFFKSYIIAKHLPGVMMVAIMLILLKASSALLTIPLLWTWLSIIIIFMLFSVAAGYRAYRTKRSDVYERINS